MGSGKIPTLKHYRTWRTLQSLHAVLQRTHGSWRTLPFEYSHGFYIRNLCICSTRIKQLFFSGSWSKTMCSKLLPSGYFVGGQQQVRPSRRSLVFPFESAQRYCYELLSPRWVFICYQGKQHPTSLSRLPFCGSLRREESHSAASYFFVFKFLSHFFFLKCTQRKGSENLRIEPECNLLHFGFICK